MNSKWWFRFTNFFYCSKYKEWSFIQVSNYWSESVKLRNLFRDTWITIREQILLKNVRFISLSCRLKNWPYSPATNKVYGKYTYKPFHQINNNKLWCILQHLSQTKIPLFQTHLQTELGKKFTLGTPLRNHSGKREVTYANATYDNVTLLRCTWSTPCETTAIYATGP